ncbi:DUF1572 family protein [Roseiconus lacunae]|uniref:DUF1572 family protein n=1 Tax=Roseiconus lacunae TaxID=2605694 RepID=A0ABT7PH49_9BACT|nr:DUF1572 family protein [Roseiconus lacunae]MDM4015816.1 DUF1572 family protein [Roseiconus lacunae]
MTDQLKHLQTFRSFANLNGAPQLIVDACEYELNWQCERIVNCLEQLSDDQIWSRPLTCDGQDVGLNRIGDLVRHLDGNLSQWTHYGLGGDIRFRDRKRDLEFQELRTHTREELIDLIQKSTQSVLATIQHATDADWGRIHHVQSRYASGVGAILHTMMHLYGHTQEVISLTRRILGNDYRFHQDYSESGELKK